MTEKKLTYLDFSGLPAVQGGIGPRHLGHLARYVASSLIVDHSSHIFCMTRRFAKTEGGTLMARGLYKNLVTHLVMLEGEGLIETEDIAVAVIEAQGAAKEKGVGLHQPKSDLQPRGETVETGFHDRCFNVSDFSTPMKKQNEPSISEPWERNEELYEKDNSKDTSLLDFETDPCEETPQGGKEMDAKKRRRSGSMVKEEWLVRIQNRMEENKKKVEDKLVEVDKKKVEEDNMVEEDLNSSSILSISSTSSSDSMPVLSDQSKEGPCLLLSSPPVLEVRFNNYYLANYPAMFLSFSSLWICYETQLQIQRSK